MTSQVTLPLWLAADRRRARDLGGVRPHVVPARALLHAPPLQPRHRGPQHAAQAAHPAVQARQAPGADRPAHLRSRSAARGRGVCGGEQGLARGRAGARAATTPRRSCRRSRPMRISASARGSRAALSTFLYRVRLGYMDESAMQTVDPDAAVIFVINHRSNMDYVLVTYMALDLLGAELRGRRVGARVAAAEPDPLDGRAISCAATRASRSIARCSSRYVHLAVAGGLTQAMFPEGGLTRDGKLRPPKLGLLSYMVSAFDPKGPRDAVFVPVGINYDRVIEDRVQVAALTTPEGEKPRFKFSPEVLFGVPGAQRRAALSRQALPLRLCLRELRQAGLAAPVRHRARHRFPHARRDPPLRRDRAARRDADAESRRGGAGAPGVAGRDRRCSRPAGRSRRSS